MKNYSYQQPKLSLIKSLRSEILKKNWINILIIKYYNCGIFQVFFISWTRSVLSGLVAKKKISNACLLGFGNSSLRWNANKIISKLLKTLVSQNGRRGGRIRIIPEIHLIVLKLNNHLFYLFIFGKMINKRGINGRLCFLQY